MNKKLKTALLNLDDAFNELQKVCKDTGVDENELIKLENGYPFIESDFRHLGNAIKYWIAINTLPEELVKKAVDSNYSVKKFLYIRNRMEALLNMKS